MPATTTDAVAVVAVARRARRARRAQLSARTYAAGSAASPPLCPSSLLYRRRGCSATGAARRARFRPIAPLDATKGALRALTTAIVAQPALRKRLMSRVRAVHLSSAFYPKVSDWRTWAFSRRCAAQGWNFSPYRRPKPHGVTCVRLSRNKRCGGRGTGRATPRAPEAPRLDSHAIPRQGARPPARRAPRRDPPRGGPYASRGTIHRGETPHGSSGTARASGAAAHLSVLRCAPLASPAGARRARARARAPCSPRRSLRPTSRRPTNTHSERARVGRFSTVVWWGGGPLRIFCVWLVPYACFERVDRGNW